MSLRWSVISALLPVNQQCNGRKHTEIRHARCRQNTWRIPEPKGRTLLRSSLATESFSFGSVTTDYTWTYPFEMNDLFTPCKGVLSKQMGSVHLPGHHHIRPRCRPTSMDGSNSSTHTKIQWCIAIPWSSFWLHKLWDLTGCTSCFVRARNMCYIGMINWMTSTSWLDSHFVTQKLATGM